MAQDSVTGLLITTIDALEAQTAMTGQMKPVIHVLLAQYLAMPELQTLTHTDHDAYLNHGTGKLKAITNR